jgi:Vps16, N-terminal region
VTGSHWDRATRTGELLARQERLDLSVKIDFFRRKIELYQLEFPDNINLEQMNVYAASYGGPIAVTKDPKKSMTKGNVKPVIHIFTSSGHHISTINVSEQNFMSHDLLSIENIHF